LFVLLGLTACVTPAAGARTSKNWVDLPDGSRLYVESAGEGSETLIVPLAVWFAPDLAPVALNRKTVFYGLRGRSRSVPGTPPEIGIDADVAELESLRQSLGLERISILGWSYMAGVAVRYALRHPERVEKLVLVSPIPVRKDPHWNLFVERFGERIDPDQLRQLEAALEDEELAKRKPDWIHRRFLAAYMPAYVSDPDSLGRMKSRPWSKLDTRPDRAAAWQERVHVRLGDWDWREEARTLRCPVLVVHGEDDPLPIAAGREWSELLPDASLLALDGVGHLPWLEEPFAFFVQVESFLGGEIDEAALFAIAQSVTE
jgi:pimeloyl-ACP methyl ester carboxylesterase